MTVFNPERRPPARPDLVSALRDAKDIVDKAVPYEAQCHAVPGPRRAARVPPGAAGWRTEHVLDNPLVQVGQVGRGGARRYSVRYAGVPPTKYSRAASR